jgi:hypothetical protein
MEERKTLHFERLSDAHRRRASGRRRRWLFVALTIIAVGALAMCMLAIYVYGFRVTDLVQALETKIGMKP